MSVNEDNDCASRLRRATISSTLSSISGVGLRVVSSKHSVSSSTQSSSKGTLTWFVRTLYIATRRRSLRSSAMDGPRNNRRGISCCDDVVPRDEGPSKLTSEENDCSVGCWRMAPRSFASSSPVQLGVLISVGDNCTDAKFCCKRSIQCIAKCNCYPSLYSLVAVGIPRVLVSSHHSIAPNGSQTTPSAS